MSAKDLYIAKFAGGILGDNIAIQKKLGDLASDFYDASVSLVPVNDSCTNAKLANMATQTIKGRKTAATGDPEDLTLAEVRALLTIGRVVVVTDDKTLTAADSGGIFVVTADAKTMSLPAGADGLEYTFKNGGAAGAVLLAIDPNGSEIIVGTTNASTNVVLSGGAGKKLLNTKATAQQGDTVKVTWVTGIGWFADSFGGIWASES